MGKRRSKTEIYFHDINNQERHHAENKIWEEWEETDQETDEEIDTTFQIPVREDG